MLGEPPTGLFDGARSPGGLLSPGSGEAAIPTKPLFPIDTLMKLEDVGGVRRFAVTLRRKENGLFGLGLNDYNIVTVAPEGSGLEKRDIVVGVEDRRLGKSRLDDELKMHGEATIELEIIRMLQPPQELRRMCSSHSSLEESSPRTAGSRKWFSRAKVVDRKPLLVINDNVVDSPAPERSNKDAGSKAATSEQPQLICGWRHERLHNPVL